MSKDKKVLLWFGDGPDMPTGFGNELRQFISYLPEYNHIVLDIYQHKFKIETDRYMSFSFGRLRKENYQILKGIKIDAILTFGGLWMTGDVLRIKDLCPGSKWIVLYRVDGLPIWKEELKALRSSTDEIVVPSMWLEEALKKLMIRCTRIPEGVSLDLFKVLPDDKRQELKKTFENKLVYGCTNRNIYPRKFYDRLINAFSKFAKGKDDVYLLLHCDPNDPNGWHIPYLVSHFNIQDKTFGSNVRWDVGTNLRDLVNVYNQIDVFVSTSGGESFGRGYIEAMACGCNVIAPSHTSYDELINGHGLGINISDTMFLPKLYYSVKMPSIQDTADKMQIYYDDPALREKHRLEAIEFAKGYDIRKIMEQWKEYLARVLN